MPTQKYALLLSYLGTGFCGWQSQDPGESGPKPSIQDSVQAALARMTQEHASVVASGRTDAGVHATGQVAHFELREKILPEFNLLRGLNTLLPPAVRVLRVAKVAPDFHAQHDALRKQYSFYFQVGAAPAAHLAATTQFLHKAPDLAKMNRALESILGEHDFRAFQGTGAKPQATVRTLFEAEMSEVAAVAPGELSAAGPRLLRMRVVGSGFLKHMVRNLAGTLLEVGEGIRPPEDFERIIASKDRREAGPTAEPQGLFLERVVYANGLFS